MTHLHLSLCGQIITMTVGFNVPPLGGMVDYILVGASNNDNTTTTTDTNNNKPHI